MNWKTMIGTVALSSSLFLSACGTNDNNLNDNNTAMRNRGANEPTRVIYNPGDYTGGFNNNNTGNFNHNINDGVIRDGTNNLNRNINNTNPGFDNNINRNINNTNRDFDNNINRNVNNINNNGNRNINNNRVSVADKAADKIAALREVDRANVLVTNNNAYVAAKLADNASGGLAKDVEKKISDIVKSTDRNIDHVYVSVNPDFYSRTTNYANDIRNGHPASGLFNEFSTLVRRVFPSQQ